MSTYRVGRTLGRTVYRGDHLIGMMDTAEDAALVVEALNERDARERDANGEAFIVVCTLAYQDGPHRQYLFGYREWLQNEPRREFTWSRELGAAARYPTRASAEAVAASCRLHLAGGTPCTYSVEAVLS